MNKNPSEGEQELSGQDVEPPIAAQVKIFALNDCEWWAGYDLDSVKAAFLAQGYGDESSFDDDIRELNDGDKQQLIFVDDLEDVNSPKRTFKEQLDLMIAQGEEFPCFFAGTEY